MSNTELIAEARLKGSAYKGWDCDGSASICDERVELIGRLADALEAAGRESADAWDEGFSAGHECADANARTKCLEDNPNPYEVQL